MQAREQWRTGPGAQRAQQGFAQLLADAGEWAVPRYALLAVRSCELITRCLTCALHTLQGIC